MNPRILILGATGMLGHTLVSVLSARPELTVHSTARKREGLDLWFSPNLVARIHTPVEADNFDSVLRALGDVRPDVVINCIGVIKQLATAKDPLLTIPLNSLFPHRLALACRAAGARLIHISTDCVFSGHNGGYVESDPPDAEDLYGRSKLLGEIDYAPAITLRTSIIGHELKDHVSLVDWFLAQTGKVRGFTRAIYTGFPTVEMARIIAEFVIPRPELSGLYHVSSDPICKYDLLCLVRERYRKEIGIEPYDGFVCDRSLDSTRFRTATGYTPPTWPEMIDSMWENFKLTAQSDMLGM
jgi:dTDP-4-dehydrorhamnose reductase